MAEQYRVAVIGAGRPWRTEGATCFGMSHVHVHAYLFLTRPVLAHYTATRDELLWRAGDVFGWIAEGKVDVRIGGRYPLAEAARAHRDLEARRTTGKLLLIVREDA